jgi:hypothetical protein
MRTATSPSRRALFTSSLFRGLGDSSEVRRPVVAAATLKPNSSSLQRTTDSVSVQLEFVQVLISLWSDIRQGGELRSIGRYSDARFSGRTAGLFWRHEMTVAPAIKRPELTTLRLSFCLKRRDRRSVWFAAHEYSAVVRMWFKPSYFRVPESLACSMAPKAARAFT